MDQIDVLNDQLLESLDDKYPIDLTNGKMGFCIYYYYLFRWEEKEEFKQIAEKLLDDVVSNLSETMIINVESGLTGIAMGISHLVKEKFIDGDINEILEDVDSYILKKLLFSETKDTKNQIPKAELIQLLYYLYLRYTEQTSADDKYIFQELMIKIIELFKHNLHADFLNEHFSFSLRNYHLPAFLYIIGKIYDLNIYKDRIAKILEEFIHQIISIIPVLHANRLYLLWGLIHIKPCLPDYTKEIDSHIRLLKESIDMDHIVNTELKNQDIYIMNGLSCIYILLFYIQMNYSEYRIDYTPPLFFHKISHSEAWNTLLSRKFYFYNYSGLLDGFPGANLVLLHIKNHFL
jgi:hypothetical protein